MNSVKTNLDDLAIEANKGLAMIRAGEDQTIEGWLIYGAALNEGRERFPSHEQFGQWVEASKLSGPIHNDRAAAMWAAAFPDDFEATQKAYPNVRTVRGLHTKFKEADGEVFKAPTTTSAVYVYQIYDCVSGEILHPHICKIGRTDVGVEDRLDQQKSQFWKPLLIGSVTCTKSAQLEDLIHTTLEDRNVKGLPGTEWFKIDPQEALETVKKLNKIVKETA